MTEEIAVEPHPSDPERFAWRLSVASVTVAGPFSHYPGVDRTLLVVEGNGMELRLGAGPWRRMDRTSAPLEFAGETAVDCRLVDGPVRDFNVMVDRATTAVRLVLLGDGDRRGSGTAEDAADTAAHDRVLVVLRGSATASPLTLGPLDALRLRAGEPCSVDVAPGSLAAHATFMRR